MVSELVLLRPAWLPTGDGFYVGVGSRRKKESMVSDLKGFINLRFNVPRPKVFVGDDGGVVITGLNEGMPDDADYDHERFDHILDLVGWIEGCIEFPTCPNSVAPQVLEEMPNSSGKVENEANTTPMDDDKEEQSQESAKEPTKLVARLVLDEMPETQGNHKLEGPNLSGTGVQLGDGIPAKVNDLTVFISDVKHAWNFACGISRIDRLARDDCVETLSFDPGGRPFSKLNEICIDELSFGPVPLLKFNAPIEASCSLLNSLNVAKPLTDGNCSFRSLNFDPGGGFKISVSFEAGKINGEAHLVEILNEGAHRRSNIDYVGKFAFDPGGELCASIDGGFFIHESDLQDSFVGMLVKPVRSNSQWMVLHGNSEPSMISMWGAHSSPCAESRIDICFAEIYPMKPQELTDVIKMGEIVIFDPRGIQEFMLGEKFYACYKNEILWIDKNSMLGKIGGELLVQCEMMKYSGFTKYVCATCLITKDSIVWPFDPGGYLNCFAEYFLEAWPKDHGRCSLSLNPKASHASSVHVTWIYGLRKTSTVTFLFDPGGDSSRLIMVAQLVKFQMLLRAYCCCTTIVVICPLVPSCKGCCSILLSRAFSLILEDKDPLKEEVLLQDYTHGYIGLCKPGFITGLV